MGFNKYHTFVDSCPLFDDPALGLPGEVGEVLELVKKDRREGDRKQPINKEALTKELGDILWYLTKVASLYDIKLKDIANTNVDKLTKRHDLNG
jgi:NTP pyrophosphatase (non-canonical NTP hydrolase)